MYNNIKNYILNYINFIIVFVLFMTSVFVHSSNLKAVPIQENISNKIIRFHVIANSDYDYDQALKLKIKTELNKTLTPYLINIDNIDDARNTLQDLIPLINETASKIVYESGYDYSVNVLLDSSYFPVKSYGNFTFPAGVYESLKVNIGNADGKNWWCVMFPPLCLVDETYSVVPKDSEDKLKYILSDEEFSSLKNSKMDVKYKFKIWSKFLSLFK
ncbi:MAG TPA: stage II sporulation protein R [Clostridiales bacterium]|nr:stage II sporulation protein R [Clostridiales bacterium]